MTDTVVMSVISSSGWHEAVRNTQLASVMHNALFWLEKVSNPFAWCVHSKKCFILPVFTGGEGIIQ